MIRQIYPDAFFTTQLNIPPDKIGLFLEYIDVRLQTKDLLKRKRISTDGLFNQAK